MKKKPQVAKRIAAACVVATGIALLWALGINWLGMIKRTILPSGGGSYEGIQTTIDGTTVINTYTSGGGAELLIGRRTLDGKPWPLEYNQWLQNAYFPPLFDPPGIIETPLPWSGGYGRTAGATDGKLRPTAWYLVMENNQTGSVYAAGFDGVSKMPVGYMGQQGFRASKLPPAEEFVVPRTDENCFGWLTMGPYLEQRRLVDNNQIFGDVPARWTIYLLGIDRLWEIDLRQRSVKSYGKFDGAKSIGQMSLSRATFDRIPTLNEKERAEFALGPAESAKEKTTKEKEAEEAEKKSATAGLVGVRQRDQLIFFDMKQSKRVVFTLPEQLRKRGFSALLTNANQLMATTFEQYGEYWSGGPIHHLYWIDPQGRIEREMALNLTGWVPPTPQEKAWGLSEYMPESIVCLLGVVLGAPLYLVQVNFMPDFASAVAFVTVAAWMPLLVILLVSVVLVLLTVKLQRKYRRSATVAWSVFVFLVGVPGFIAYLVEHHRAKLEACSQCGEVVPRDREMCADCNTEFAPPARVGTEIFA
jgi:hypothetical protein